MAAANSKIDGCWLAKLRGARHILDLALKKIRRRRAAVPTYSLVSAQSIATISKTRTTGVYVGEGVNQVWCLNAACGQHEITDSTPATNDEEIGDLLASRVNAADIVFVEDASNLPALVTDGYLRVPSWVKQRLRVLPDWQRQVAGMRRGTRQEISRFLRRHQYTCRLTADKSQAEDFYDRLYVPHIDAQFGNESMQVGRDQFLRECQSGIIMQLVHNESVVAAALLRHVGKSLAIVWSGISEEPRAPAGSIDVLDYFSLLYAHLARCAWLDFGPSRPSLTDGTYRYKRKWGCEVFESRTEQPIIYLRYNNLSAFSDSSCPLNAVLCRDDNKFVACIVVSSQSTPEAMAKQLESAMSKGVDSYRILPAAELRPDQISALEGVGNRVVVMDAPRY